MNDVPLVAVKCPKIREKGGRRDTRCGAMVIPGKDWGYCGKCCAFFRVIRSAGRPVKLVEIPKAKIEFLWLILEYEKS